MSNKPLVVNQLLGVTPNCYQQTFSSFFVSLSCASRAHDEKGTFSSFFNAFHHFWPYEHMRKHVFAGRNTQQSCILSDAQVCNGNMRQWRHVELVDVTRSAAPQKHHNANPDLWTQNRTFIDERSWASIVTFWLWSGRRFESRQGRSSK